MNIFDVLNLILGLSFFLFGIHFMGDALKRSMEGKQSRVLNALIERPGRGFLVGALVTAVIQSSSATTVMIVGLVHSGAIQIQQAVSVIFGANVGTSATSLLTAMSGIEQQGTVHTFLRWLKPSSFVPIVAFLGVLFYSAAKTPKKRVLGSVLLGFSILMVGMNQMSDAVVGLKENETFRSILLMFENPFLGVLAGAFITAIIQSSSASIGILQSLTATGAITFGNAVPIIMGQNIGTCVTAMIASIGSSREAKRIASVHLLFNFFGTLICMAIFYLLRLVLHVSVLEGKIDMWGIAFVHLIFNIVSVVALYPFRNQLVRLSRFLVVREKKKG